MNISLLNVGIIGVLGLLGIGFYALLVSRNLIKVIVGLQIVVKGAMVALVDISAGMFFQEYRRAFKKLAHQKKVIFIPAVLSRIITNPSMKSDFLHPTGRGYKIVANRIHQAIAAYIK